MNNQYAFSTAVVFESVESENYNSENDIYTFTPAQLEHYAKIIAYKVAYNLKNGFFMNPNNDPLNYEYTTTHDADGDGGFEYDEEDN